PLRTAIGADPQCYRPQERQGRRLILATPIRAADRGSLQRLAVAPSNGRTLAARFRIVRPTTRSAALETGVYPRVCRSECVWFSPARTRSAGAFAGSWRPRSPSSNRELHAYP